MKMDNKKSFEQLNSYIQLLVLLLPALFLGLGIGVFRNWQLGAITAVLLSVMPLWKFRDIWLKRDVSPTLRLKLNEQYLSFIHNFKEVLLATGFLATITVVSSIPDIVTPYQPDTALFTIILAISAIVIFIVYVLMRWIIIRQTNRYSIIFVLFAAMSSAFIIIHSFAEGYAVSGIIDTTKEETAPDRMIKFSGDDLKSLEPETKKKIKKAERDLFYFSIVTFTTLGYGDFQPTEDARMMAAIEALCGLVFMAFMIAVLFNLFREFSEQAAQKEQISFLNIIYIFAFVIVAAYLLASI
ncbi:MAG: hypothetical protein DBP03_15210 [gamma proteobacterium symbiont of Ctena orbiculata]|nr:potassium channel family protein [Candidatus Thiodiazotropha taylori]MBV2093296.1 potassium channel family protein [Candidatus Thiodiazotropha sp. (ex Codakia orbicularis)]PUB72866.1 MAG: hypothetical protein DBP03_15210 [gamma proteobacterium symbiont of Ctena orbiculata]PUB76178.1 MAG: hypothetical protein DBO99_14725 [gamma proteobacterium symbiont of Ctena orbiculata]